MKKIIFALFMLCISTIGYAKEECATQDGETLLALPHTGEENKIGPHRLRKGEKYEVGEKQNGWVALNINGEFAWALESNLATICQPVTDTSSRAVRKTEPSAKVVEQRRPQTNTTPNKISTPSKSANDGGCPCSGSRVCTGPRGGRYCITNGGSKRYGV